MGLDGLEWVVNSDTLTIAALTLFAGRLGGATVDAECFLSGLVISSVASLGAGVAPPGLC